MPELSQRGSWIALGVAVAAAMLLNVTLLASFVWPDWLGREVRMVCWMFVGVTWGASAGVSAWLSRRQQAIETDAADDPFREATEEYLKGNWFEAERVLGRLLRRDDRDLEARLMLASLLRHTKRFEEATRQLNILVRMEDAEQWALEIRREGELLTEARRRTIPDSGSSVQDSNGDD